MTGSLTNAQDVVDAARATLEARLPAVLTAMGQRYGVDLPMPAEVDLFASVTAATTAVTPSVAVADGGMTDLTKTGRDTYDATYRVIVRVLSRDEDYDPTSRRSRLYGAAVVRVFAWWPTLGGLAQSSTVTTEGPAVDIDAAAVRTLAAREVEIDVLVPGVIDGPSIPDWPIVTVATTELDAAPADPEGPTP